MAEVVKQLPSRRSAKKYAQINKILVREECKAHSKKLTKILKKDKASITEEEQNLLEQSSEIVKDIEKRARYRQLAKDRKQEIEDEESELKEKCEQLSQALQAAKYVVVYTGAGISTAASIPDYRGPNGVWTRLQEGREIEAQDLSDALPTYTHLSLTQLYKEGLVKHVVSQNCDGLHLRSGLPRHALSEVHGNMYIELCTNCEPQREYIRLFDTTERTGLRRHTTNRKCYICSENLRDTIVHFGEKGRFLSPYNWEEAAEAADTADLVLCLGSSLKVLRRYQCLWHMQMLPSKRPQLFVVNLQWTPKDELATLKINGRCDTVMEMVMKNLSLTVPPYQTELDPIFQLCSPLLTREAETTCKKVLIMPEKYDAVKVEQLRQEICRKNGGPDQNRRKKLKGKFIDQKGAVKKKLKRDESDTSCEDTDYDTDTSDSSVSSKASMNEPKLDMPVIVQQLIDNRSSPAVAVSSSVPMSYQVNEDSRYSLQESSPRVCTPGSDLPPINVSEIVEMAASLSGVPNDPLTSHIPTKSCDTLQQNFSYVTAGETFAQSSFMPGTVLPEYKHLTADPSSSIEQQLAYPADQFVHIPESNALHQDQPPVDISLPITSQRPINDLDMQLSPMSLPGFGQSSLAASVPNDIQLQDMQMHNERVQTTNILMDQSDDTTGLPSRDSTVFAPSSMNGARVFSFNKGSSFVLLHNDRSKKQKLIETEANLEVNTTIHQPAALSTAAVLGASSSTLASFPSILNALTADRLTDSMRASTTMSSHSMHSPLASLSTQVRPTYSNPALSLAANTSRQSKDTSSSIVIVHEQKHAHRVDHSYTNYQTQLTQDVNFRFPLSPPLPQAPTSCIPMASSQIRQVSPPVPIRQHFPQNENPLLQAPRINMPLISPPISQIRQHFPHNENSLAQPSRMNVPMTSPPNGQIRQHFANNENLLLQAPRISMPMTSPPNAQIRQNFSHNVNPQTAIPTSHPISIKAIYPAASAGLVPVSQIPSTAIRASQEQRHKVPLSTQQYQPRPPTLKRPPVVSRHQGHVSVVVDDVVPPLMPLHLSPPFIDDETGLLSSGSGKSLEEQLHEHGQAAARALHAKLAAKQLANQAQVMTSSAPPYQAAIQHEQNISSSAIYRPTQHPISKPITTSKSIPDFTHNNMSVPQSLMNSCPTTQQISQTSSNHLLPPVTTNSVQAEMQEFTSVQAQVVAMLNSLQAQMPPGMLSPTLQNINQIDPTNGQPLVSPQHVQTLLSNGDSPPLNSTITARILEAMASAACPRQQMLAASAAGKMPIQTTFSEPTRPDVVAVPRISAPVIEQVGTVNPNLRPLTCTTQARPAPHLSFPRPPAPIMAHVPTPQTQANIKYNPALDMVATAMIDLQQQLPPMANSRQSALTQCSGQDSSANVMVSKINRLPEVVTEINDVPSQQVTNPVHTTPGWFGKGLNVKKHKRKRSN